MDDLARFVTECLTPRRKNTPARKPASASEITAPSDDLRSALAAMPATPYDLWISIGQALKELGEPGKQLWLEWSRTDPRFDNREALQKWESFDGSKTSHKAVFSNAAKFGWSNPGFRQDVQSVDHSAFIAANDPRKKSVKSNLIIRPMSEVKMTSIEYLWPGWYPYGYITLIAGETGAAKTTAVADMVAKVSNGLPFPGENEGRAPAKVLWLGSEDGIGDMTVPRLMANGAKLENIIEIQGVNRDGVRSTFSMQDDILNIVELLKDGIARNDPYKVIVIDPITSYLSGTKQREVKINDAGQLRGVLEPWLVVAQQYKLAIVCITHFMKDTTRSMLHRVLGSAAFGETCRSLIAFVDRSSDEEPFGKSMIQVKTNLPEHPGGAWLFETEKVQVGVDAENGKPIFATRPKWDRLEALVSLDNSVAKSGAYSDTAVGFAVWIGNYFQSVPDNQGVLVAKVKADAIAMNVITEKNWEKHSPVYLEKKNVGGVWECRPRSKGA